MQVKSERISISEKSTESVFNDLIFITVRDIPSVNIIVDISIGSIGHKNKKAVLQIGEAIFYEASDRNVYEIRLLKRMVNEASFIVSQIDQIDFTKDGPRVQPNFFIGGDSKDKDEFTPNEINALKSNLLKLERRIIETYTENKDQIEFIHRRVRYLSDAIERQSKADWIHTAIGVFMTIAVAVGISAANNDNFWTLIKDVLGRTVLLISGQ